MKQYAHLPAKEVGGLKPGEFAFVNLPPGPYLLEFYCGEGPGNEMAYVTYPRNVSDEKDARVIDLAAGQKVRDLVIRLPFPSEK